MLLPNEEVISIYAPREGGDGHQPPHRRLGKHFNPRPPRGGRPAVRFGSSTRRRFQSTPPARGATSPSAVSSGDNNISIHAPREGGDREREHYLWNVEPFQSTPPARGATSSTLRGGRRICNFNPRPPRGGRRGTTTNMGGVVLFQSTPPARGATTSPRCHPVS